MCLAKAYLGKEIVLEDIAKIRVEGNTLSLRTLFGEQKQIEGILKEIDFQGSKVVIEKLS